MQCYSGQSPKDNPESAFREATQNWPSVDLLEGGIIFCFYAHPEWGNALATLLSTHFPNITVAGCSTAGEWINGFHYENHLVMMSIVSSDLSWSAVAINDLAQQSDTSIGCTLHTLLHQLELQPLDLNPNHHVCISLIDGLSMQEERIGAILAQEIINIPILGGSSGDGWRFKKTSLLFQHGAHRCQAISNGAVLLLLTSERPVRCIKHHHFDLGDKEFVVTSTDTNKRIIHTLDGIPAAQAYADAVGCNLEALSPTVFAASPLIHYYRNHLYIRSIQKVEENGSITLYCNIEEGVILNLGVHKPMLAEFEILMDQLAARYAKPQCILLFNCVLRAIESKHLNYNDALLKRLSQMCTHHIGFDTYGEQWQGQHVNQTLAALFFY